MTIADYALLALIAIKIAGIPVLVYVILWHIKFIRETKKDNGHR